MKSRSLVFCIAALVSAAAFAQDLSAALEGLAAYRFGDSREPLTVVQDRVRESLAAPEQRAALAGQLAAMLATDISRDAKDFICRQLVIIGDADNVPALAALLADADTADMARYALERIPAPAAGAALLAALPNAAGATRIGLINSLGARRESAAIGALAALAVDPDPAAARAALHALGSIGTVEAGNALAGLEGAVAAPLQAEKQHALLLCADRLAAAGSEPEAAALYAKVLESAAAPAVRAAAFRGVALSSGDGGMAKVVDALGGPDPALHRAAIALVRDWPGEHATTVFARRLGAMSAGGRAATIAALADRGDPRALPAIVKYARDNDETVRRTTFTAMGKLGDASCVPLLAQTAATAPGLEGKTARDSLYAMRGEDVDREIVKRMGRGRPELRVELIRAAAARSIGDAVPALLGLARHRDESVRAAALEALAALAAPSDLDAVIALLASAATDTDRVAAESAVVAAAGRSDDTAQAARIVIAALPAVSAAPNQGAMLRVLGQLGDDAALDTIRAALGSGEAEIRAAAVTALAQWPRPNVLDDLLALVRFARYDDERSLALGGYVRLLGAPGERPVAETLQAFDQVYGLLRRDDDRRLVLAGLGDVGDPGALEMLLARFDEEAVRGAAVNAALTAAQNLAAAHPDAVKAALARILEVAQDEYARVQAKSILDVMTRFEDYVTAWVYSGPYTEGNKEGEALFDTVFAPEKAGAKAVWSVFPAMEGDRPWLMDFQAVAGLAGDHRVVYLRSTITAPAAMPALAELGSDDGIKVWLNGELAHANNASRGNTPGDDTFPVAFKQGANTLLLKVVNRSSDWSVCIRFRTPDGDKLEGLRFSAE